MVERLKDLHSVLEEEGTKKYLIPMIEGTVNDKKWRTEGKNRIGNMVVPNENYGDFEDFLTRVLD